MNTPESTPSLAAPRCNWPECQCERFCAAHGGAQSATPPPTEVHAQAAQIAELQQRLEDLDDGGIHSCGPTCQRPICVLKRERDALKAELDRILMQTSGELGRLVKAESDLAALRLLVEKKDEALQKALNTPIAGVGWEFFHDLREALALTPDSCAKEVRPNYQANDMALLRSELTKYRERLAWLGNPANKFVFSVTAGGQIKVFKGRSDFTVYPTMEVAIDDAARAAKESK